MRPAQFTARLGGIDVCCKDGGTRFVPWNSIGVGDTLTLWEAKKQWPELPGSLSYRGVGQSATLKKLKKRQIRKRLLQGDIDHSWQPPVVPYRLLVISFLALLHGSPLFNLILGNRSPLYDSAEIRQYLPAEYWIALAIFLLGTAGLSIGCLSYIAIRWILRMTRPFPTSYRILPQRIAVSLSDGRIVEAPWSQISDDDALEATIPGDDKLRIGFHPQKSRQAYELFQGIVELNRRRRPASESRNRLLRSTAHCAVILVPILVAAGIASGLSAFRLVDVFAILILGVALMAGIFWLKMNASELARATYRWRRRVRNGRRSERLP